MRLAFSILYKIGVPLPISTSVNAHHQIVYMVKKINTPDYNPSVVPPSFAKASGENDRNGDDESESEPEPQPKQPEPKQPQPQAQAQPQSQSQADPKPKQPQPKPKVSRRMSDDDDDDEHVDNHDDDDDVEGRVKAAPANRDHQGPKKRGRPSGTTKKGGK